MTKYTRWRVVTWLMGAVTALWLSVSVASIPVQVSDSLVPLLQAQSTPSVAEAAIASASSPGYFRPLRIAQIQALYQLSSDRYHTPVFRGFHVLWVLALFGGFLVLLDPRTATDCCVAALAMSVLVGHHAFLGTVWEAYPINHFLEIGVLCLLTLVVARARGSWWADALAAAMFLLAAGTLESGLLVWVVVTAAWLSGWRGVAGRTVLVVSVLLAVYAYVRFGYFAANLPGLTERDSGFWTARLSPSELQSRFGANPLPFYLYNVGASLTGLLFAEPRAGVFTIPLQLGRDGRLDAATWLNTITSAIASACVLWSVARRVPGWLRFHFDEPGRLLFVACAVIVANAAISYGYTKDEIMSPAGIFYALAVFASVRDISTADHGRTVGGWLLVGLLIASAGWTLRAAGTHFRIHQIAFSDRQQWLDVDLWLAQQRASPTNDGQRRLVERLRDDAIGRAGVQPALVPAWADEWFR